ncbi:MAG TPA: hypothetical protein VM901_02980 [Bdellovibrionota bacterium]|jgi:hypothetical protein|nr:hypothetical protein [Bdellovibrionota bacterium]
MYKTLLAITLGISSFTAGAATRTITDGFSCTNKEGTQVLIEFGTLREIEGEHGHALPVGKFIHLGDELLKDLKEKKLAPEKAADEKRPETYLPAKAQPGSIYSASVKTANSTVKYLAAAGTYKRVNFSVESTEGAKLYEIDFDRCKAHPGPED